MEHLLDARALTYHPTKSERVFYAHHNQKAVSPPLENLAALLSRYDKILLEAVGSHCLALKIRESRDSVDPPFVQGTIALFSMSALGKPCKEVCYGFEYYREGFPKELVSLATYRKLLKHPQGILKRVRGTTLILANQARHSETSLYQELVTTCSLPIPLWFCDLHTHTLLYRNAI